MTSPDSHPPATDALATERERRLVAALGVLKAARPAEAARLLAGKHLGLLTAEPESRQAHLLREAALALGAQVSMLRPSLAAATSEAELQSTARLLGRLYSGVACLHVPAELVMRLATLAGVPVFDATPAAGAPAPTRVMRQALLLDALG